MAARHHSNPRRVDLSGQRFGRWTVIAPAESRAGKTIWQCRCDCGTVADRAAHHLVCGASQSCGCTNVTRDGLSHSPEYGIWCHMIRRCHVPENVNYRFYGATGTYVCEGWRGSFETFYADMGARPSPKHSIDRLDTTGSYTCGKCDHCTAHGVPFNCRWATKGEQARNQKSNRYYTHDGKTLILKDWARLVGIKYLTLWHRLDSGWSFEDAIGTLLNERYGGRPVKRANRH